MVLMDARCMINVLNNLHNWCERWNAFLYEYECCV